MKKPSNYQLIPFTEITTEAREIAVAWGDNMRDDFIAQKHKLASDIMNYAREYHREQLEKTHPGECFEYCIIPVTFTDYNQYVDCMNDFGRQGWEFMSLIRNYKDSPYPGQTTHDFVCKRKISIP